MSSPNIVLLVGVSTGGSYCCLSLSFSRSAATPSPGLASTEV